MYFMNLFQSDLSSATAQQLQRAIVSAAESQRDEGFRIDFKRELTDAFVQGVVAFANTFGGILVIGVTDDTPRQIVGVDPPRGSDLKTQICNKIGDLVSPPPDVEVETCACEGKPGKMLAVVRVQSRPVIHMYLKGDRPVYVRNNDRSVPAKASELRSLLERVQLAERETPRPGPSARATLLNDSVKLNPREDLIGRLSIFVAPERPVRLTLDSRTERQFRQALHEIPLSKRIRIKVYARSKRPVSQWISERSGIDWYRVHADWSQPDFEFKWVLLADGAVMCCFDIATGQATSPSFSSADILLHLRSTISLADRMWRGLSYYGAGSISAMLVLQGPRELWRVEDSPTVYSSSCAISNQSDGWTGVSGILGPFKNGLVASEPGPHPLSYEDRQNQTQAAVRIANPLLRGVGCSFEVDKVIKRLRKLLAPDRG
jgi:hypothetical protein